jgi:hypothetical protein
MSKQNPDVRWDIQNLQDGNWHTVWTLKAESPKQAVAMYRRDHAEWAKGKKFRAKRVNPGAFARCVASVKKRGGAADPRAVCAAAGRAKYGQSEMTRRSVAGKKAAARRGNPSEAYRAGMADLRAAAARLGTVNLSPSIAQREEWRHAWGDYMKGWNAEKRRKNPPEAAMEAYEDFHGREPDEMVEVTKQVHYHKHLAGAGKLEKLEVISRQGQKVILSGFKGALLAFNEKRTQLFIEGGDQAVDLKQFGIWEVHEMEVLGDLTAVEYFTRKDHLGKDGGTAVYRHKFSKPYPELQYDVMNEQLIVSGGNYVILAEGIDR